MISLANQLKLKLPRIAELKDSTIASNVLPKIPLYANVMKIVVEVLVVLLACRPGSFSNFMKIFQSTVASLVIGVVYTYRYSVIKLAITLLTFALFVNSAILIVTGATLYENEEVLGAGLYIISAFISKSLAPVAGTIFMLALHFRGQSDVLPTGQDGLSLALTASQVFLSILLPLLTAPLIYFTCLKSMTVVKDGILSAENEFNNDHTSSVDNSNKNINNGTNNNTNVENNKSSSFVMPNN
ncbi:uncharacterized protein ASCRUDRAFT_9956 [Ascoidea rubescens DSM 1968]|uniref:Uncharacterized protein n=1 Tax=Ascoidea rubescens DSM 1968 TaxID=1344418 RepID=A0A1D2VBA7_9ASCO|nr:hypothetical protein ASCRUDRAFT_9956 [Ascoidea rubescens DSM 1968]ODV58891.1 hypothetical protein ASCRUDRAFT_9956 [Ascoidea rubescens DSM 1968]